MPSVDFGTYHSYPDCDGFRVVTPSSTATILTNAATRISGQPAGGHHSFGFQATDSATNSPPTNFRLNTTACTLT